MSTPFTTLCGVMRSKPKNMHQKLFSWPKLDQSTTVAPTACHNERHPLNYHDRFENISRPRIVCTDPYLAAGRNPQGPWQQVREGSGPLYNAEICGFVGEQGYDEESTFDEVDVTPHWWSWEWSIGVAVDGWFNGHRRVVCWEVDGRQG